MSIFDIPGSLQNRGQKKEEKDTQKPDLDTTEEVEEEEVEDTEEEVVEEEVVEEEENQVDPDSPYAVFSELNLELPEDAEYDQSPDGIQKMIDDHTETVRKEEAAKYEQKMQDLVKQYESSTSFSSLNPEEPTHANHLITQYYKSMDWTDAEIAAQMELLNSDELRLREAQKAQVKLVAREDSIREQKEAKSKADEEARVKAAEEEYNRVVTSIDTAEELAGFKVTPKMRKEFKSFILDADEEGRTGYQKVLGDKDKMIEAIFMTYVQYNRKDLLKSAQTEVMKSSTKKKSRFKSNSSTNKTGKTSKPDNTQVKKVSIKELASRGF